MTNTFNFKDQFAVGEAGENYLDRYYSQSYDIKKVSDFNLQKRGIDRCFKQKGSKLGCWFTVEYKVDFKAGQTGNVFIELEVSNKNKRNYGWAQKLFAQALLYYVPKHKTCYYVDALLLKSYIERWSKEYRLSKPVMNKGNSNEFWAIGLLVPITEFETAAYRKDYICFE